MQIAKTQVIFLSLVTLKKPQDADVFIKAAGRDLQTVRKDLLNHYPAFNPLLDKGKPTQSKPSRVMIRGHIVANYLKEPL